MDAKELAYHRSEYERHTRIAANGRLHSLIKYHGGLADYHLKIIEQAELAETTQSDKLE